MEKRVTESSQPAPVQKQPYVRPELRKQGRIEDMTQDKFTSISRPINY